ncbi:calcium/calmodulin-dependent protein kinase kinase 1-like [Clytia hemisphaerica]|uniref:Protein kinase domain-containing protein n=1 Tax=Clytia hemisphaerica TaxID=252671 RepID=A0A7M5XE76_9CNID
MSEVPDAKQFPVTTTGRKHASRNKSFVEQVNRVLRSNRLQQKRKKSSTSDEPTDFPDNMGPACTKKAKVDCKNSVVVLSPRSNKISPLPPQQHVDIKLNNNDLSVDEVLVQGTVSPFHKTHHHITADERFGSNIPDTIMEEEQLETSSSTDTSSSESLKMNSQNRVNSILSSREESPNRADSSKPFHTSVPNLRTQQKGLTLTNRVTRSSSHDEVKLRKNLGSTDLFSRAMFKRNSVATPDISRHGSVENVLNPRKERRKSKTPTIENRIHNLEADQVNYYQLKEEIGRGSFGSIYKCHSSKDKQNYAMKVMSKRRLMRKSGLAGRRPNRKHNPLEPLHREIAILKKMDHPNIVKLVEVMDDVQVDNVYMVFELMQNGVVIEVATDKVIEEERARRLFQELLLGIEYLHYSKIIHRDIKPANLLLDDNDHIKIADFGVSDMFEGENDLLSKHAGSPAFQAPEVHDHDSRDKYSGKAVDVWAMGITLFCFLYGKCPFYSSLMGELITKIKSEPLVFPESPIVNPQAKDLISRMLAKDPKERINVLEMKEHHWVTDGGRVTLAATEDHCSVIEVTDEEVKNSVKIISKLSSLVFAKSILKGRSFVPGRGKKNKWKRNHSLPTPNL